MLQKKPDFLIIGAQKAATSWIYQALKMNNEIWTPPVKEFHFFDEAERIREGKEKLIFHFFNKPFRSRKVKALFKSIIFTIIKCDIKYLRFALYYAFAQRGTSIKQLGYYSRMFSKQKISGDITPAYAVLNEDTVKKIHSFHPQLKVIFVIRNPVERFWSAVKMNHFRIQGKYLNQFDKNVIRDYLKSGNLRNNYFYTISVWEKYFGKNFHVLFYDELKEKPEEYLKRILNVIGARYYKDEQKKAVNIVGEGEKIKMSLDIEHYLYTYFYEDIEKLYDKYKKDSPYPEKWLNKARQIINN